MHLQCIENNPIWFEAVYYKKDNESNKLLNNDKTFQRRLFLKFFDPSDINQDTHKLVIQKKWKLSTFSKKFLGKKEKNLTLVYPGLRYAHKK